MKGVFHKLLLAASNIKMRNSLFIFFGLIALTLITNSQTYLNKELLDSATINGGIFVLKHPIKSLGLSKSEVSTYNETLLDYGFSLLDTIILNQLVENSKQIDTTDWIDIEISNAILIDDISVKIDLNKALNKFNSFDTKQRTIIKQNVEQFNSLPSYQRNIWSYSKPVFDNYRKYAVVGFWRPGGGGLLLLHLTNNSWHKIGYLKNWRN